MNTYLEEGDPCPTEDETCKGRLVLKPVENCSCHLDPPCWEHENQKLYCPECGWEE